MVGTMAGAGVKPGITYGQSDEHGIDMKAVEATDSRMRQADCVAILTDHADFNFALEFTRGTAGAREHRRAVGIGIGIDEIDRIVQCFYAHHRQHRAENFVAVNAHVSTHVVE